MVGTVSILFSMEHNPNSVEYGSPTAIAHCYCKWEAPDSSVLVTNVVAYKS